MTAIAEILLTLLISVSSVVALISHTKHREEKEWVKKYYQNKPPRY